MQSRWYKSKPLAIMLRNKGFSIGDIENRLGIARSTLSSWIRNIELSPEQRKKLVEKQEKGLAEARRKAILWHHDQKKKRMENANTQAAKAIEEIDIDDKKILELALSILYMGEGTKKKPETAMGSSNPIILKFFLSSLKTLYNLDNKKIKCQLNLRADQDPEKMKYFWSRELKIPLRNFGYINLDKRTIGSKTYPGYKGVCQVLCGNVAIQRKLVYMSEMFCKKIIRKYMGS